MQVNLHKKTKKSQISYVVGTVSLITAAFCLPYSAAYAQQNVATTPLLGGVGAPLAADEGGRIGLAAESILDSSAEFSNLDTYDSRTIEVSGSALSAIIEHRVSEKGDYVSVAYTRTSIEVTGSSVFAEDYRPLFEIDSEDLIVDHSYLFLLHLALSDKAFFKLSAHMTQKEYSRETIYTPSFDVFTDVRNDAEVSYTYFKAHVLTQLGSGPARLGLQYQSSASDSQKFSDEPDAEEYKGGVGSILGLSLGLQEDAYAFDFFVSKGLENKKADERAYNAIGLGMEVLFTAGASGFFQINYSDHKKLELEEYDLSASESLELEAGIQLAFGQQTQAQSGANIFSLSFFYGEANYERNI